MREIKFRMWNDQAEKFHYGMGAFECLKQQFCGTYDHVGLNQAAFEQFTGLTDKNGVEIYDGDIMHDPEDDANPYQVLWCDQSAQWYTHCEESESCSAFETSGPLVEFAPSDVVIGNIHEHAELIKEI